MPKEIFKYHLFDSEKYPLYVDANGNIQRGHKETLLQQDGLTPARLRNSPEAWKDTNIKYFRNIKYWGLFRDMMVPLKFPGDGAKIIKHYKWNYGREAVLYIGISKLDLTSHPDRYKTLFVSELNLAKVKQVRGGVVVEAMEGGLIKNFKAYENTNYEIPVDDAQAFYVKMDGMEFDFNRKYSMMTDQACYGTDNFYMGMVETSKEGNAPEHMFQDVYFTPSSAYPNNNWFHSFDAPVGSIADMVLRIKGTVKVYYDKSVTPFIRAEVNDGSGISSVQTVLWSAAGTSGTTVDAAIDSTITVPAGSRAHLKLLGGNPADSTTQFTIKEGELSIEYVYKYKTTYVKCIYLNRLLQLLTDRIGENKYSSTSTWLSGKKDIAVTCGDSLRSLTGTVIKTTIGKFYKSVSRWGAGLSIKNDVLIIEQFADFFKTTSTLSLGEVSNFEVADAEDIIFNTIKCGYEEQNYTDVNGRSEVNQGQEWSTPGKRIVRELDLVSDYRADPLGAELARINFEKKTTTDASSDNDTWMLNIETTPSGTIEVDSVTYDVYDLYRPAYTSVTGLPHWETSFNTELSPKRSLLENGAFIRSILDFMDTEKVTFQTANKNKDLVTTLAGVTITEKEDIQIGSLADRLFRPYYLSFKTQVPITLPEILGLEPYGVIDFTYEGITYYGLLFDGSIQPADNDTQTWKLLCAKQTDVSKFINNFN